MNVPNIITSPEHVIAVRRELCRRSLYYFVKTFWPVIIPEKPQFNWHMEYLCNEIEKMMRRVFRREPSKYDLIINISPGTSKSTIGSIMTLPWAWCIDPSIRMISGSYSDPVSLDFSVKSRDILKSDLYKKLFPHVIIKEDTNMKSYYRNTLGGDRYSTSTGGSVTGFHGHVLIIDDPLNPKQSYSEVEQDNASRWIDNTLMSRKVNKLVTPLILIMQRLSDRDPTAYLLQKQEKAGMSMIKHIRLPGEDSYEIQPPKLRLLYKGGMMDEKRMSQLALEKMRIDLGEYGYAAQIGQNPIPATGGQFRTDRFHHMDNIPADYIGRRLRYWDKAGKSGGGCRTAGVLFGQLKLGGWVILDVVTGQWGWADREEVIKNTAISDGYATEIGVEVEGGSGGMESAERTVANLSGFIVHLDRPVGDKTTRAQPFACQLSGGTVSILDRPWTDMYIQELKMFPRGRFRDQVDATSGAFNLLNRPINSGGSWR